MNKERCQKCGGLVEKVINPDTLRRESGGIGFDTIIRALPDTLEGIEAAMGWSVVASDPRVIQHRSPAEIAVRALERLFNGCETCRREPLGLSPAAIKDYLDQGFAAGKRQAFQQAAEMAEKAAKWASSLQHPRYNQAVKDVAISLASDLRKLAEEA